MICFRCTGSALQRHARHAALRRERTSTLQAMQIHETVSPARWCVNFADLQFLELEVRQAIKDGEMCACDFASSQEDCGQDAELYGPSIYIVNDSYIKPITAAAGKMSWALMMNPNGLDADLFITHAWQEGIFEFIEKVLASWPPRARHAWCCMLANPQNLDIGAMIQSPKVSPFAIALQQSKYMLVVPNRHSSVYTRLWCGYEAYLAFEGQKIIRTARRSILRPVAVAWMRMIPAILLGIACGSLLAPEFNMNIYLAIAAFLASVVTENFDGRCCLIANHLGVFTSVWLVIAWQPPVAWIQLQGLVIGEATMMQRLLWLTATMFFAIAEIDRITFLARDIEGKELRRNFQGSLRFASCSQLRDEEHIRVEIGNKVTQVDQIIQVLIAAGMTSPALRDAALKGVNIDHAGDAALAIPVLFSGPQLLCGLFQLGRRISLAETTINAETVCFQAVSIAARIGFLILLCRRPIDERYFIMKVMTKLVSALLFPCLVALVLGASTPTVIRIVFVAFHMSFVLVLFFAVLGIRGTLKLPCGRHLVQVFLSRFVWGCFSRPCSCPRPRDEDSSSEPSEPSSDSE